MNVTFSTTRVQPLHYNRNITPNSTNSVHQNYDYSKSERLGPVVRISFRGNSEKQAHQFASFSAEDKGLGLKIYNAGGEAVVVQEQANSWGKHLDADYRAFLPYHAPDNADGKLKIIRGLEVGPDGKLIHPSDYTIPVDKIVSVDADHVLQKGESFIVQDVVINDKSKYIPLERTEISGTINRLADRSFEVVQEPYHVFKVLEPRPNKGVSKYLIYTPEFAKTPGCYKTPASQTAGAYTAAADDLYATAARIFAKILPSLNDEKHGYFNPANLLLHDRQAFPAALEIAARSAKGDAYYNGVVSDSIFHNPGRAYQGYAEDGLAFLRKVVTDEFLDKLKELPDYETLKSIDAARFRKGGATKEQIKKANEILKPFLEPFIDDLGTYNMTKIAMVALEANPKNMKMGTVSPHYEYEMLTQNAISEGLTKSFARLKKKYPDSFISVLNGSTPANMKLGDQWADFGRGKNGFSTKAVQEGFTVFQYAQDGSLNLQQVLEAKRANTKWLLNHIAEAAKDVGDAAAGIPSGLQKLFYNEDQINKDKSKIIGELAHYEDGDKLIMGWGRPDEQKGMAATVESFLKFLQDPEVPVEVKKKTKMLAGAGVWDETPKAAGRIDDWKNIKAFIEQIQNLDGGIYAKNIMYVNGFFPNRLAVAATHSIFTSRFEPCGITPLESYVTGTPVTSVKTGGAPNFIQDGVSGFLTKTPYLVEPEAVGRTAQDAIDVIDDARREAITDDLAKCIKKAILLDDESYSKMVASALSQKVDWHENNAYNNGLSANRVYTDKIFGLKVENEKIVAVAKERNTAKLNHVFPSIIEVLSNIATAVKTAAENATESAANAAKSMGWGKLLLIVAGVGAAGYGTVAYVKKQKAQNAAYASQTPQPVASNPITTTQSQPVAANQSLDSLISSSPVYSANIPKAFNKIA